MMSKAVKIPGPDHPILVTPNPNRAVVTLVGKMIGDTTRALIQREACYAAVQYVPCEYVLCEDVDMAALSRTWSHIYCPY